MEEEKKQLEQELLKHKSEVSELKKGTIQRKDLEEEFTCSICQGLMVQATAIPSCGHSFCAQCIEDWLTLKKVFPFQELYRSVVWGCGGWGAPFIALKETVTNSFFISFIKY